MWEKRGICQLICLNVFICHQFLSCFVTLVLKSTEGKVTKLSSMRGKEDWIQKEGIKLGKIVTVCYS